MRLKDIMSKPLDTVSKGTTLDVAAQHMRQSDVGALPVVEDDSVAGIVTDRDMALRGIAEGLNMRETTVREVMTPQVVCQSEDDEVGQVVESMQKYKVRRVVVVDRYKKPTGIISLGDIANRTSAVRDTHATLSATSKRVE